MAVEEQQNDSSTLATTSECSITNSTSAGGVASCKLGSVTDNATCVSTSTSGTHDSSAVVPPEETHNDNATKNCTRPNPKINRRRNPVENPTSYYDASVSPLTDEQKQHFQQEGYLKFDNVIPPDILADAQKLVNDVLQKKQSPHDRNTMMDTLRTNDAILNLLKASPVITLVQHLMGKGNLSCINTNIAQLRMIPPNRRHSPEGNAASSSSVSSTSSHVDGLSNGKHSPFSVLVGISLSDWTEPNNGNFCVWPGSHTKIVPILREILDNPKENDFPKDGVVLSKFNAELQSLDNGTQIYAAPGDAVIVHHKLAHGAAPNFGPNMRQQVYFRLLHTNHFHFIASGALLDNVFVEFEGINPE